MLKVNNFNIGYVMLKVNTINIYVMLKVNNINMCDVKCFKTLINLV